MQNSCTSCASSQRDGRQLPRRTTAAVKSLEETQERRLVAGQAVCAVGCRQLAGAIGIEQPRMDIRLATYGRRVSQPGSNRPDRLEDVLARLALRARTRPPA